MIVPDEGDVSIQDFPTEIRLEPQVEQEAQTDYSAIEQELIKWIQSSIALFFSLLLLLCHLYFDSPILLCLTPLIFLDIKILVTNIIHLKKSYLEFSNSPSLNRFIIKDLIEAIGTFIFKFFQIIYWTSEHPNFLITLVPLLLTSLIRIFMKGKFPHECASFSSMFCFLERWLRLLTLFSIGLKLDEVIDWNWTSAVWPIWLGLSFLSMVSIGVLLLSIGSLFSYLARESSLSELLSTIWMLYFVTGAVVAPGLFVLTACEKETGVTLEESTLIFILFLFGLILSSSLYYNKLVIWWDLFFLPEPNQEAEISNTPEQIRTPRSIPSQIVSVLKKPPRILVRLSSTYFKPAESLSSTPAHRQTTSETFQTEDMDTSRRKRCFSHELPSSLISNVEEYTFEGELEEQICPMCCEKECNAVIMECGHGGICYDCSLQMWKSQGVCHMCREPISQVLQIKVELSKRIRVLSSTRAIYARKEGFRIGDLVINGELGKINLSLCL